MTVRQYGRVGRYQLSQSLIEEIMSNANNGTASISIRKYTKTITSPIDKVEIGSLYFTKETDQLLVFKNSVYLEEGSDYIINSDNTISKADGTHWIASESEPDVFNFVCLMNIPEEKELHGSKLVDSSVSESKLDEELRNKISGIKSADIRLSSNNDILMSEWAKKGTSELYSARLTHNLNSEDLMVTVINKDTRKNLMFSCASIDANTIELEIEKPVNARILVVDTNSTSFAQLIDDNNISKSKTLSSDKIYSTFALKGENTGSGGNNSGSGSVYKTSLSATSWINDGNDKKCTIKHNLNTIDIIDVIGYTTDTNDNLLFSIKIIDANTIELKTDKAYSCRVLVIGSTLQVSTSGIDASNVAFSDTELTATNVADAITELKGFFTESIRSVTNELREIIKMM